MWIDCIDVCSNQERYNEPNPTLCILMEMLCYRLQVLVLGSIYDYVYGNDG